MATDLKIREIITSAKELGIDVADLIQDKTWYRVGQRGHLHLDRYCYKMTNYRDSTDVTGNILDLKGKVCTYCYESNLTVAQAHSFTTYQFIVKANIQLDTLESKVSNAINASSTLRSIEIISTKLDALKATEDIYETINNTKEKVNQKLALVRELQKDSEKDMINYASIQNLEKTINFTDDNSIYTRVFGKATYTSNYEELWRYWSASLLEKNDLVKAKLVALEEAKKFKARRIKQLDFPLEELKMHLLANKDLKSIDEALSSLWSEKTTQLLEQCITEWEESLSKERGKVAKKVVAIASIPNHNEKILNAIFGYYTLTSNKLGGSMLVLPEVLATYLLTEINGYGSYRQTATVHTTLPTDNEDTFLTALTLWMPERYSRNELANFENALVAARNL